jgi:hypothetical protein
MALTDKLYAIADAIRLKTGRSDRLTLDQFASEIEGITVSLDHDPIIEPLVITENGSYTASDTVDGYSPVTVQVENDYSLLNSYIEGTLTEYKDDEVVTLGDRSFDGCDSLTLIDTSKVSCVYSSISHISNLTTLILRNTEPAYLTGSTTLTGVYIYVPSNLVSNYSNQWKVTGAQFRALEDYTVDGTITGELDPAKI